MFVRGEFSAVVDWLYIIIINIKIKYTLVDINFIVSY